MTLSTRFHISKFFTKWEIKSLVKNINDMVDDATTDFDWIDGKVSLIAPPESNRDKSKIKRNYQLPENVELNNTRIWPAIDGNKEFVRFTYPKKSTSPLITKTPTGGFYKPHFDMVDNGHFSTTIFMNDPSEYDGGELIFWLDGKEVQFKLEAGWGITYETGIGHRVNEVTRGDRLAMVFWTTSYIHNLGDLREWNYWGELADKHDEPICDKLDEYVYDPHVLFRQKRYNIMRKYMHLIPENQVIA
jgi:PKHD-type hydroxylase